MKCVFCGAVKNCAPFLQRVFKNIEQLGSLFDDYAIVLYVDKSIDNSHNLLVEYAKNNPRLTFEYNINPVSEYRTQRIAHARNECLKIVHSKFASYPYFIMMDFDDVCSQPVKIDVLKKYLYEDTWDALSFNKNPYYDIWALSIYPFVISFFHMQKINRIERMRQRDKKFEAQRYITNILAQSKNLVPCVSAFNGFAIYRASKFENCHYDGRLRLDLLPLNYLKMALDATRNMLKTSEYGNGSNGCKYEDCEHRSFHIMAKIKNDARIMIAPEILFN